MRLTSEIIRDQINEAWDRVEVHKINHRYAEAICEEYAIPDLEKAYGKALKREKKEARKWWQA